MYQALKWAVGIDIFTADDTVSPADFSWRSHTKDNPVTKALVLTAADEFRSTDVNEDNIESYLDAIHDVGHGGFDKIFTVGKIDENRARSSEVNFWRDLNEIACRNPQVCNYFQNTLKNIPSHVIKPACMTSPMPADQHLSNQLINSIMERRL